MKIIITVIVLVLVLLGAALAVILTGWYNVAASTKHTGPVLWAFETLRDNSIERNAGKVQPPAGWDNEESLQHGISHYDAMCVVCHGAPGVAASEFAQGMYPVPPDLAHFATEFTPEELYWTVKHGIKMTGMPGFGVNHTDNEIWGIVAFLKTVPDLSPEAYKELAASAAEHGHDSAGQRQPMPAEDRLEEPADKPAEETVEPQPEQDHPEPGHVHTDDHVH